MSLRIMSGRAGRQLAAALGHCLGVEPTPCAVEQFPDGELRPRVGAVRGDDVYLVHPTGPPVNDSLVELVLLLDACRRAGAALTTAVVPYFGYARQDRRTHGGEAVGARAVADVLIAAGTQRLLVVDPHTPALEAMFAVPVEMLTAVPVLVSALAGTVPDDAVVVAPDLGAVKLAGHVADALGRPVAVVRKTRVSGAAVRATELIGDVSGRPLLIVDDMVSTGATIEAAAHAALSQGAAPDVTVATVHALLVGDACARLARLPIRRMVTTDTVPPADAPPTWLEVHSVAPLLAEVLGRLQHHTPLDELLVGGRPPLPPEPEPVEPAPAWIRP
jgi:ribose-phosphate pyrophosphokinase